MASKIDVERAKHAKDLAEQQMAEIKARPHDERDDFDECEADLKWCEIQLEVASKRS